MESFELLCNIPRFSSTDHSSSSQQTIAPYEEPKPTLSDGELLQVESVSCSLPTPLWASGIRSGCVRLFRCACFAGVGV